MIEIYQQKMATILTVAIQTLVVGGLIACIVVGAQDRPSPVDSPAADGRDAYYLSENTSPAAYSVVGHQPGGMPGTGEETRSFWV